MIEDDAIRNGFETGSFLVRSSSSTTPHYLKRLSNGKYTCDKACLGFNTRNICSHVLSVAHRESDLKYFLQMYKKGNKKDLNLTAVTTFGVNKSAGRKRAVTRGRRNSSPDPVSSMKRGQVPPSTSPSTIGELFHYQARPSDDPLKITIRRSRPDKPAVTPTTSTPFQLIEIKGKIRKCAGCRGELKEGPDEYSRRDADTKLCIRHKEHDFVFIDSYQHWKKTFENKHYHVFVNCIKGRNLAFLRNNFQLAVGRTLSKNEVAFLEERMGA